MAEQAKCPQTYVTPPSSLWSFKMLFPVFHTCMYLSRSTSAYGPETLYLHVRTNTNSAYCSWCWSVVCEGGLTCCVPKDHFHFSPTAVVNLASPAYTREPRTEIGWSVVVVKNRWSVHSFLFAHKPPELLTSVPTFPNCAVNSNISCIINGRDIVLLVCAVYLSERTPIRVLVLKIDRWEPFIVNNITVTHTAYFLIYNVGVQYIYVYIKIYIKQMWNKKAIHKYLTYRTHSQFWAIVIGYRMEEK